jgi:putative transposase
MDVGITEFLTLSDGIQISNPKNLRKSEKKLAKMQRQLSTKQKGSRNRNILQTRESIRCYTQGI